MNTSPRRPRCPFYGFHWPANSRVLKDSGGDECGLDFENAGPCAMAAKGQTPDYDVCPVADRVRPLLEGGRWNIIFQPAELPPTGISFDEWKRRVMTRARGAT